MDPASAIGVASAAITFLGFSIEVCKTFSQIITSEEGLTKHNADVAETVKRYKEMSEVLKAKGASATSLELGPNISRAVDESISVSTELVTLLERLRQARDAPVIGPLKAVYRSLRSREQIERLQRKTERCQADITQVLLQATWETSTLNRESSNKAFQHLDNQDTEILAALKAGNSDLFKKLIESDRHTDNTLLNLQNSVRTGNDKITQKIDSLSQKVLDMTKPDLKTAFVNSLFFLDHERREKDLSGPSPKTFEWIFNRDGVANLELWGQVKWPSFPQWLENTDSSQQYWLSGKAGCGKSTLMAHVIRDDMAFNRTKGHLKKWHGTKSLHVLKFFLFRPGRERQAGLTSLLQSLLYQLVTSIPIMQEILMANFLPSGCGIRIPTWPVTKLKAMLVSALDAAEDCCFLIFIDGADEFEDFQHARGEIAHATDLVDFFFDIQQPGNVKLCISSRPELRIANVHPSFLEAKLADLNHDDIRRFVDERMQAMTAISEYQHRDNLAWQIARRADGIFLWAAFAVTQISKACRDGYGNDYSELMKRLDDMGKDLNDAISQMLRSIERPYRPALAFYLQALKSWQDCHMRRPLTVGLIAASQSGKDIRTRSNFLAACQRERLDIENFSQGIIEIRGTRRRRDESGFAVVRSHSEHSSESDIQHETLDFEPGEGAWVTVSHSGHYFEITQYFNAGVSLIHRSAYDFFFAPDGWDKEHVEQCRSIFDQNDESKVPAKLQAGLRKLLWIKPWPMWNGMRDYGFDLTTELVDYSGTVIRYTVATSNMSSNPSALTRYLDDLFTSMRLELLLVLVKQPILESRKRVPGDIFSIHLHNGCLRTLDEDKFLIFESTGLQEDLRTMARFESRFIYNCSMLENLNDCTQNRLSVLHRRAIAPLVQASLLDIIRDILGLRGWFGFDRLHVLLLSSVQRWMHALARRRRSKQFYNSVWQWTVRLVLGYDNTHRHEDPKRTMLNISEGRPRKSFQWTPLASDSITGWREEVLMGALVSYGTHLLRLPGDSQSTIVFDRFVQIMEHWDVWIELHSAEGRQHNRTALLVRMSLLFNSDAKGGAGPLLNPWSARYHLACFEKLSHELLFSIDIHPSIDVYDGPEFKFRKFNSDDWDAVPLEQKQIDVLINAVRQDRKLDDDQKECMIEGIRAFPMS